MRGAELELRTYQRVGVDFLRSRDAALLADEMGLGKTVQVARAFDSMLFPGGQGLVVCPAALKINWEEELTRWAPHLSVRRVVGDREDREASYSLPAHVLIASYDEVRHDRVREGAAGAFEVAVLDEAQRVKNASSKTALACGSIRRARSWALTGTPIENRTDDLVSIFRFLKLGLLFPGLSKNEIHKLIRPHFLRRRKEEVLGELPPLISQVLHLELSADQKVSYREVRSRNHDGTTSGMLALINRLKQIANFDPATGASSKLAALRSIVVESTEQDKILVFSQYVRTLERIRAELKLPRGSMYHGGLGLDEREERLQAFRRSERREILLVSLKAGGVGLNLQETTIVVMFDRWWNPAVEQQAIARAHRFGRTLPLHVFYLTTLDTIEQRIDEILKEKEDLFEEYIEEAESAIPMRDVLERILI